jgi:hypothetical protein
VLLPGFTKAPSKVLLLFIVLLAFYRLPAVGLRNPACGYTTYPMCECWSLYKVSFKNLSAIIDMLENFDFFIVALAPALWSAQNL